MAEASFLQGGSGHGLLCAVTVLPSLLTTADTREAVTEVQVAPELLLVPLIPPQLLEDVVPG